MPVVGIVARGEDLAGARALARSLAAFHPDWPISVLLLPGLRPNLHPGEEPFELLGPNDLLVPTLERLDPSVRSEARVALVRPLLALHLLDRGADGLLMLAADAEVLERLDALAGRLAGHDAVLVPRLSGILPRDGLRPDAGDLLAAGEIDDGIVAVGAGERGRAFADWWAAQALELVERGAGGNPLAAAPRVFADVATADDRGLGVSYWNLHERPLAREGGELRAGGHTLRVLRWEGFRPDRPWWLSDKGSRVLVLDDPVLTELVGARVRALRAGGWIRIEDLSAAGGELPGGIAYDARLRRMHSEAGAAGEQFGDVFTPAGADALIGWLAEPAPQGAGHGLNRYAYDVWLERADVRDAYPELDGPDGEGFLGWVWMHGRPELGLQEVLLPPAPAWIEVRTTHVPPVLVTGYLRGTLGLGQASRGYVSILRAAGVPVATRTVPTDPPVERRGDPPVARPEQEFAELELPAGTEPEINLVCVNADQLPGFVEQLGAEIMRGRYTIGQWAWETDRIPERWDAAFALVDEVWVYSSYVADSLARASGVPIVVMPLPVTAPAPTEPPPAGLPDGFLFLFSFDFFSTIQRKNPVGLVRAFIQAFADGEGPQLVIKSINAEHRLEARERLRYEIGGRSDIHLLDQALSPGAHAALFARADCYVSLHRSEGYGLTMAEAMALGKPVIATGYSGNTDFMTPSNSYLVDWTLTEVGSEAEHYPADASWAEPSTEHAAALMREVWTDREGAQRRGERAAADIAATLSPEAIGRVARERLVRIAARRAGAPSAGNDGWPHLELPARLGFDLTGASNTGGARALARRGLFRALKPYTTSERALDEVLAEAVRRLSVGLESERAAGARERRRNALRDERVERGTQRLETLVARLDALEAATGRRPVAKELAELTSAARAIPYMEGEPFTPFKHPVAGRVLGYREGGADVGDVERYRSFEDVFRGTRERVRALVEPYVELLRDSAPILDVGCGRGELLEALRDEGVRARGVDLDTGMVREARKRGLEVDVADGIEFLEGLPDGELGAIVSMQVIEHLPREALLRLFELGLRKLRPGGLFVAETVNPHAGHALKTFWVDLTHQHPVFPEVALALARDAGFREGFICHLAGVRDLERDRFSESSYALVATA
jgi:SAM-dependent methyltransferase/glycosyltransferase involved in cell wall biosynthesis